MTDIVNGSFELLASIFLYVNVRQAHADKAVAGVHWSSVAFFTLWGYWNLFFYPSHNLWYSFAGGILVVILNTIWTIQLIHYRNNRPIS